MSNLLLKGTISPAILREHYENSRCTISQKDVFKLNMFLGVWIGLYNSIIYFFVCLCLFYLLISQDVIKVIIDIAYKFYYEQLLHG